MAGNFGLRYVELDRKATGFVRSPGLDQFFAADAGYELPAGQTAPLTGPGVLAYAQGQVDAGNYAQLDDFYNSNDTLWARSQLTGTSVTQNVLSAQRAPWLRAPAASTLIGCLA